MREREWSGWGIKRKEVTQALRRIMICLLECPVRQRSKFSYDSELGETLEGCEPLVSALSVTVFDLGHP